MQIYPIIPQRLDTGASPTFAGLTVSGTSIPSITLQSTDASDPTIIFKTTNTAHQIEFYLDESAVNDVLWLKGRTVGVDTRLDIESMDGEIAALRLRSGLTSYGTIYYSAADILNIRNNLQDGDLLFGIDDGGALKTIRWDADVDKLKHSAGTFDFDDDNITTSGTLTLTGCSVLGLNSAVFQPTTDSTTFFQVLDADGGTPIFNVNTTDEKIGIGTASPSTQVHIVADDGEIRSGTGVFANKSATTDTGIEFGDGGSSRMKSGAFTEVDGAVLSYAINTPQLGDRDNDYTGGIFRLDTRDTSDGGFNIYGYPSGGATAKQYLNIDLDNGEWSVNDNTRKRVGLVNAGWAGSFISPDGSKTTYLQDNTYAFRSTAGNSGFGELAPETAIEITDTAPYLTLHNSTHEDTDGGRESRLIFKGEQSGGEETTLARIEVGHDGAADDEKGYWDLYTNDGSDGDSPTKRIRVDSAGNTKIGDGGATNYVEISSTGDVVFVGGAGLCFAEIYTNDAANELTITVAGQANKVQITSFTANGVSNNCTPDHTNDHITITKAGIYLCSVSIACASAAAGGADRFGFAVYKNNGTTEFLNLHSHRKLAGGGTDYGSVSISGIIDLAVNDTIEVWVWNEDSTDNIVIDDITLSLIQVGGT